METQQTKLVKKIQDEDLALFNAIKEFQQGNQEQATFIYEQTKKYTYRMIHQHVSRFKSQSVLTGDENSIAEDVMQELYLDFFKNISKFRNDDPKSFYKWISIVSNRMVLKYVDKNKMEVLQSGKDEDFREDKNIWDSTEINDEDLEGNRDIIPEAALEDKEFQKLIMDFVQSLPEVQAQTVIFHFYSGMKYQEIADEMGVSLITVKTRMRKAQDSLKQIVSDYEKKSGTKLHSLSVLPMLWILYRLFAEETEVPAVVDASVTNSLISQSSAASSGIGNIAAKGATTLTRAISTKGLVAIVSATLIIGGAAVGSQMIDREQGTSVENEQKDSEKEERKDDVGATEEIVADGDGESEENDAIENDTSEESQTNVGNDESGENNTITGNTETEHNNSTDANTENGNNTDNSGSGGTDSGTDNSGSENTDSGTDNSGSGNTDSGTDNSGSGDTDSGTDNSGSGDADSDTGSDDSSNEATVAKGTRDNPYGIGDTIVGQDSYSSEEGPFDVTYSVTEVIPFDEGLAMTGETYSSDLYIPVMRIKIKITGTNMRNGTGLPMAMFIANSDWTSTASLAFFTGQNDVGDYFYDGVEYTLILHAQYKTEDVEYSKLKVSFYDETHCTSGYHFIDLL